MRSSISLILLICLYPLFAQDQGEIRESHVSFYMNLGQAVPLGSFRANGNSEQVMQCALASPMGHSVDLGATYHMVKWIGLTWGISSASFVLDPARVTSLLGGSPAASSTYTEGLSLLKIKTGITGRFSWHSLLLEPRLTVGLTSIDPGMADYYELDPGQGVVRTLEYQHFSEGPSLSFQAGCQLNFLLVERNYFKMAMHAFSELSYQRPEFETFVRESTPDSGEIRFEGNTYRQAMLYWYNGIGLMIRIW